MKQKQHYSHYTLKFSSENDLNSLAVQVFDRTAYEYKAALNEYAMLYRLEDDATDALLKIFLLGRILGNTVAEIDHDINEWSVENHD